MADYVLEIRYGEDDAPLRIPLVGYDPDEAETKRQSLVEEIEHALKLHTPPVSLHDMDADLPADVAIDPSRVTDVALVEGD